MKESLTPNEVRKNSHSREGPRKRSQSTIHDSKPELVATNSASSIFKWNSSSQADGLLSLIGEYHASSSKNHHKDKSQKSSVNSRLERFRKIVRQISLVEPEEGFTNHVNICEALCYRMERILTHNIRSTPRLDNFLSTITLWDFLSHLPDQNLFSVIGNDPTLKNIPSTLLNSSRSSSPLDLIVLMYHLKTQVESCQVQTKIGQGRAILRLALNNKILSSWLSILVLDQSHMKECFEKGAMMRDPIQRTMFLSLIDSLSIYDFCFDINNTNLDRTDHYHCPLQETRIIPAKVRGWDGKEKGRHRSQSSVNDHPQSEFKSLSTPETNHHSGITIEKFNSTPNSNSNSVDRTLSNNGSGEFVLLDKQPSSEEKQKQTTLFSTVVEKLAISVDYGENSNEPFRVKWTTKLSEKKENTFCPSCKRDLTSGFLGAVVDLFLSNPGRGRYCFFTGYYFCDGCHTNRVSYIPSFVVNNWDFKKYPVCDEAFNIVQKYFDQVIIDLSKENPNLPQISNSLLEVMGLRHDFEIMNKVYLYDCRKINILDLMEERYYLFRETELFSLRDLVDIHRGTLTPFLETIHQTCSIHITTSCKRCYGRGNICQACHSQEDLCFEFETDQIFKCPNCFGIEHLGCHQKDGQTFDVCKNCLKVNEIGERKISNKDFIQLLCQEPEL